MSVAGGATRGAEHAPSSPYPSRPVERDAWIIGRRPARREVTAERAYAALVEDELCADGVVRPVATVFLTNRECPWRCLMCDLWTNTLTEGVPPGSIVQQLDAALAELPQASVVKLYNSGSFFDRRAIPPSDYGAIAARLSRFSRVIVECHPALVGPAVERFRDMLDGDLEVAMGLEIANPDVLERLNKRMTLQDYAAAAERLRAFGVASRAFVLVQPPFVPAAEAVAWAARSAAFAFDHGAGTVSLIPVRGGNGALEALAATGEFAEPSLATLEAALEAGLGVATDAARASARGRVFADTWDLARFSRCDSCRSARAERLRAMNLTQRVLPRVACASCGAG